jgi:phosphoglycolate phosphatase-like HAD superfamily hydrolase
MMIDCIIFDIDGTVANLTHRLHFITQKPKNWPRFKANIVFDTPIGPIVHVCQALNYCGGMSGPDIIFCSGRSYDQFDVTCDWIEQHIGIKKPILFMRAERDYRDDVIVKRELLTQIRKTYNPILVFDDRQRVVDMWRSEGLICCQVARGDF